LEAGLFEMGEDQFGYRVCGGKGRGSRGGLCSIAFTAFTAWRSSAWAMAGWNGADSGEGERCSEGKPNSIPG